MSTQKSVKELSYFLRPENDHESTRAGEVILFFDMDGKEHRKQLEPKSIEQLLTTVDKTPKMIPRKSGGWSPCQVIKMMVYEKPNHLGQRVSEIRVRVRFVDIDTKMSDAKSKPIYRTFTKDILPEELKQDSLMKADSNYLVDFGDGCIPVHVLKFHKTKSHNAEQALCIPLYEMKKVIGSKPGQKARLQVYAVHKSALRKASALEMKEAMSRYKSLKKEENANTLYEEFFYQKSFMVSCGFSKNHTRKQCLRSLEERQKEESGDISLYMEVA